MSKLAQRALAVGIGTALAVAIIGGWMYWLNSYTHGTEYCDRCHHERTVDGRGPFTFVSDPAPARERAAVARASCDGHAWRRVGCWQDSGGFSRYGAPPLP